MLILLSLAITLVVCEAIDGAALPRRPMFAGGLDAFASRTMVVVWIWAVALLVARRPFYAVTAAGVTCAILVIISNLKHASLKEPLVFSDFSMVAEIIEHPRLFYLEPKVLVLIVAAVTVVMGASAVWWRMESVVLAWAGAATLAAIVAGLPLLVLWRRSRSWFDHAARRLAPAPRRDAHVASLGLLGSLLVYWVRWLAEHDDGEPTLAGEAAPFDQSDYEAVVVIQSESFVDLRRHGCAALDLPAYDTLKRRARAAGLLEVPCVGAYTLRPEASILTGIGFHAGGFGAFHPYLRLDRLAKAALPGRLSPRWRKVFLHPHAAGFFRRDRAIPRLGFDAFIDETSFRNADRDGPYIGDLAVARRVIAEIAAARRDGRPIFLHVVTMEAHDPFGPSRLLHVSGATAQFAHHLRNADRMLALLVDTLDREAGRVLLVHYGDHVPVLSDFPRPFADTRTDYLVVEAGHAARRDRLHHPPSTPEDLHAFLVSQFRSDGAVS